MFLSVVLVQVLLNREHPQQLTFFARPMTALQDTGSLSRRLTLLATLYVAQGLPTGFFSQALPAILRQYGVSLSVISLSGMLALPWALKFLWAPWVDHHFSARVGQRRSWIIPMQLAGILVLLGLSFWSPERLRSGAYVELFVLLFLVNLFAATQDIAADGLAVRLLGIGERGWGNGIQVAGYRLGLIAGGGVLLAVVGIYGWHQAFVCLAAVLALMSLPILFYREPSPRHTNSESRHLWKLWFSFFRRPGLTGWLVVLATYKAGESLGSAMVKPMLVDYGYTLAQIGWMVSTIGSVSTLVGALFGGWLTGKVGRFPALLSFSLLQAGALASYGLLAWWHDSGELTPAWVYAVNAIEHFVAGMATAAILTAVMDLCRPESAGSDFTLQVSLLTAFGGGFYMVSGRVAEWLGYTHFYLVSAVMAVIFTWPVWKFCHRQGLLHPASP